MIITGLKPETNYEVTLSAINGKGGGESSPAQFFKTEPVRKCLQHYSIQAFDSKRFWKHALKEKLFELRLSFKFTKATIV